MANFQPFFTLKKNNRMTLFRKKQKKTLEFTVSFSECFGNRQAIVKSWVFDNGERGLPHKFSTYDWVSEEFNWNLEVTGIEYFPKMAPGIWNAFYKLMVGKTEKIPIIETSPGGTIWRDYPSKVESDGKSGTYDAYLYSGGEDDFVMVDTRDKVKCIWTMDRATLKSSFGGEYTTRKSVQST